MYLLIKNAIVYPFAGDPVQNAEAIEFISVDDTLVEGEVVYQDGLRGE